MSTVLANSMNAPIQPLFFAAPAPPTSVCMQAVLLVQKQPGLTPEKLFKAINYLGNPDHAKVLV
jgi:hypothetical protein